MLKATAIGNLGKDCTTNQVNGKTVINFSVAHTEKYKDRDGNQQERTTWVECAYWSDSRIADYLKKGTQVYVEGQPEVRTYPKNDGSTGASLSLKVFTVQLLGSGGKREDSSPEPAPTPSAKSVHASRGKKQSAPIEDDDSLPF